MVLPVISKLTFWPVSPGPAEIAVAQGLTVCAPASSLTVWSAPLVKLGAWFTGVMVMTKVCAAEVSTPPFAVPPLSDRVSVIVAVPDTLVAGV